MTAELKQDRKQAKAIEFLWIVQTTLLREAADVLKVDRNEGFKRADQYSGTGAFIRMDEALRAARLIPGEMDPAQAAAEFLAAWQDSNASSVPSWCARHGVEKRDYSVVSKPDQFLWTVQTALLANAENKSARDPQTKQAKDYDSTHALRCISQAIRAARSLPSDMDANEAASQFVGYVIGEKKTPPRWAGD